MSYTENKRGWLPVWTDFVELHKGSLMMEGTMLLYICELRLWITAWCKLGSARQLTELNCSGVNFPTARKEFDSVQSSNSIPMSFVALLESRGCWKMLKHIQPL
jgi:hypothetical protein